MTSSISGFKSNITVTDYSDVSVNSDNQVATAAETKVAQPTIADKFETAVSKGAKKVANLLDPQVATGEKDIALWTKQEQVAFDKAMAQMAIGDQGANNSCGTTSEANALSFFGLPFKDKEDFRFIDKAIRPWSLGAGTPTGPGDIVEFGRNLGMQAQQYSKCDLEDVARQLRAGHTVTVVTNWDNAYGAGVHYVNVIGVKRDQNGEISSVMIRNPWGQGHECEEYSAADFMKMWSNVRAAGRSEGGIADVLTALPICDRTMIVMDSPDGKKLEDPSLLKNVYNSNVNLVMNGVNGLAAGVNAIKGGATLAGLGQVTGSFINTVVGGSCYIVGELIGKNIEEGGDKLMDIGKNMLQGNVLHKIGGGLAIFFGALAKAIGWLLNTFTNIQSALVNQLTDLLNKSGEKANARMALTAAINDTQQSGSVEMMNASTGTKVEMFKLLIRDGHASADEQKAAFAVLQAADFGDNLSQVVAELGGREAVEKLFTAEPYSNDVPRLLNHLSTVDVA